MTLRNMLYYLAIIVLLTSQLWATNTNPVVTNVTFSIAGTTVTVHYDLADVEQSSVTINMEVSSDNGVTWNYNYGTANGAIGVGISTGTAKTITWTYSGDYNNQFKIKIIADDLVGDQIYYAGKIYNTVTIGTQTWLKENLDVGIMILGSQEASNNGTIEKYCNNDDPANCTTYGGLYQWNEAMQNVTTEGAQGICPTGWHLPTYVEMQTLQTTVNNDGNALKAIGQGSPPWGEGTNMSGFSALMVGDRESNGAFNGFGTSTYFWSSTQITNSAYDLYLYSSLGNIYFNSFITQTGFCVRCIKN
jgi:uncharacterized protein (TIGR02145 family)